MYPILDYIKAEWATVMKAPAVFIAALIIGSGIGWLVAGTLYEQDLQTMRDYVALLKGQPKATPCAEQTVAPTPVMLLQASHATPTPIDSALLDALKQNNAKLKAENAHLRKVKPTPVASMPTASACPSVALPSVEKMATQDCGDLLRAKEIYDEAVDEQIAAEANQSTEEGKQKYNNAVYMRNQATDNLNRMAARLCYGYAP